MKKVIKVGTRESRLAMAQTRQVVEKINKIHQGIDFEIVPMKTKGDLVLDKRLDKVGGKGLFIKELEHALLDGSIDMAVHSLKDMPAQLPEKLIFGALTSREDPRDVLISVSGHKLEDLKSGAIIGTSSARREAQVLDKRPDFNIKTLRGNVLTRLNKLLNGEYDAIILAAAGLKRLKLKEKITQNFAIEEIIPAVGQGILCIETRKYDEVNDLVKSVDCIEARIAAKAERAFMKRLNGGCSTAMGAHARIECNKIKLIGMLASEDRTKVYKADLEGRVEEAEKLGCMLADKISEMKTSDNL